jgi:DNA repair protein RecO (recombination protein O)
VKGTKPKLVRSEALLVRSVEYRESDLVLTFLTRAEGKVSAIARAARKSRKRFGGTLEPMHTIEITYDDRGGELATLKDARLVRAREGLTKSLDALDAAGRALRWLRHVCPPKTPEPGAFEAANALLDDLDSGAAPIPALVVYGLKLLAEVGYAVDFTACVTCGKPCPSDRPAAFDIAKGGLVCQACGGAPRIISPDLRSLARGLREGSIAEWSELLSIVDEVMKAHAGFSDER